MENTSLRILVAEDNLVNQRVAVKMLEALHYTVDCASDGMKAVEAWQEKKYHLIFMDCHMPVMTGLDATREIRVRENGIKQTIIIALTADLTQKNVNDTVESGMDDFLAKPIKQQTFQLMIEKWFKKDGAMNTKEEERYSENEIIDQERMNELIELDDPELIKELITIFFREGGQSLDEISSAIQKHQPKNLRAAAHKLKGGSASLGIKKVIALSMEIEQLAERDNVEDAIPFFEKIIPVFEEAKEYLTTKYLK